MFDEKEGRLRKMDLAGVKKKLFRFAAVILAAAAVSTAVLIPALAESAENETAEAAYETETDTPETETSLFGGRIYNILLIGTDRRGSGWNGNSDTMILVTINQNVDTIFLTSFMRDLYAEIPGYGVQKLNAAYACGGASLLIDTLQAEYGVHVDNYMVGDFHSVADIIDMLGGVDMEVSEAEAGVTNDYIRVMCESWGLAPEEYYIGSGYVHLNGIQAVGFMRDRFVGNNDYERTERQRNVLLSLFNSLDLSNPVTDIKLVSAALLMMDHDISEVQLIKLAAMLPAAMHYDLVSDRIPYDDLYSFQGEMLVPDFAATSSRLTATIYAEN